MVLIFYKRLTTNAKLISKIETRDGWWQELRDEVRSHAKTLGCSHVIGYGEASTIHDDVCVLSVMGTAATVRGFPFTETSLVRARPARPCSYTHVPYHHKYGPYKNMKLVPCLLCGKKWVPETILSTGKKWIHLVL